MNDTAKPALRPANENPWYCLATIHGEQPIEGLDNALAQKNCTDWNRWLSGGLNEAQRKEYEKIFAGRTSLRLPDPAEIVDFSHTHFDRPVNFAGGFAFPRLADFRSATFSREANFGGAHFHSKTDFRSATFSREINFIGTNFNTGGVDFQSATFCKTVDFQFANLADPNFRSVMFSGYANFNQARFSGGTAAFGSAVFCNGADFASAVFFGSGADFASVTFSKTVSFNAAKFNIASFEAATFSKSITFINTTFNGSTTFADARFQAQPPDFRGAEMHQATEWHGVIWPKPPRNKDDAQEQVYAFERLKQEMERLKKHEDEQKIFRMELRARRRLLWTSPSEWLLNVVYQWSSGYGNSFMRPLFWLFAVFAGGAGFFARAPAYCEAPMPIALAARLSFANIFLFLPDKREIMLDVETAKCLSTPTVQAVSAVQSLLGVVLLFLLGLALRNRFRMR